MPEAGAEEFSEVCRLFESNALDSARALARESVTRFPHASEFPVLEALAKRRSSGQPWLEGLLAGWRDAGCPTGFALIGGQSIEEVATEMIAELRGGDSFLEVMAKRSSSPLVLLVSANATTAEEFIRGALAASERATSTVEKLWFVALLNSGWASEATRAAALLRRQKLLTELADSHPGDLLLAAAAVLEGGRHEDPLTRTEVQRLSAAAAAAGAPSVTLEFIYHELVRGRDARSGSAREGCLEDAMGMLPEPTLALQLRAKRTLSARPNDPEVISLLTTFGSHISGSSTLLHRLVGLNLVHIAVIAAGDRPRAGDIKGGLDALRRIANADNRLSLDWPIEALRIEACDALAADECALLERCLFPADSLH